MKKGFTLIEILVTLVVIGIMAGLTSSASSLFRKKNDLKAVAMRGLNVIKLARNLAITGRVDVCVKPTADYKFEFCNNVAPTVTGDRANLIKNRLTDLMNREIRLTGATITPTDAKVKFNARGLRDLASTSYIRFSANDESNENVANYLIQISVSGATRFCNLDSATATTCE